MREFEILQLTCKENDLGKENTNGILTSSATKNAMAKFVIKIREKVQNFFQDIKDAEILEPYKQKEALEPTVATITPNTPPISDRALSNPFAAVANASIAKNSNEQSQMNANPTIVPVSQEVPKVDETVLTPQEREVTEVYNEVSQPQIAPVYTQPSNENYVADNAQQNNLRQDDQTAAAITTYLNEAPVRREVVDQPVLQTPQEFHMPEQKQVQDPFAPVDIKLEGMRAEINNDHNEFRQYFDMKFRSLVEEFNEKSKELSQRDNSRIDDMSREIEKARSNNRNNLAQIQSAQQDIVNEYSGGMYNAR